MSLSGLMTAVAEYVGDVLVNDCGRPAPDHVLRYHTELPHYCCTDNGLLAVSWLGEQFAGTFPTGPAAQPCTGFPVARLSVKYVVCYPAINPKDPMVGVEGWDEAAAMLADVGDCVARALTRLRCDPDPDDPFMNAIKLAAGQRVQLIDTTPISPRGLCAGVRWQLYAAVLSPLEAS